MIGKIICDLIPNQSNNRNSEGSFIKLKNGNILFAYTRYRGGGCDDAAVADIYGMISKDDGDTFGNPSLIFSCGDVQADNVMSVSLLRMKNGDIGLFYLQKHNDIHTCIPFLALSDDDGKTWYKHIRCIPEDGYFVLNNDRIITLDNGRILMPVAKHEYKDGYYLPGSIYIYASDDTGITWKKISSEITINPSNTRRENFNPLHNCMEPGVVQLDNGNIWLYIRTDLGRHYESFSEDFGQTWDIPLPSPFTAPDSPMCVKKLKSGKLFTVWNPVPIYNGRMITVDGVWTGARTPLVFVILDKKGNYNSNFQVLDEDEKRGFCYCAIHELENGDILLGYCAGGIEDKGNLNRLRIKKIYKTEIE